MAMARYEVAITHIYTVNGKDYILLREGDNFQPSCFDQLNDAKNKMFGLAYDAVKKNLGPVFDALHRGPKTCNNCNTYSSFVHYLKVVGLVMNDMRHWLAKIGLPVIEMDGQSPKLAI